MSGRVGILYRSSLCIRSFRVRDGSVIQNGNGNGNGNEKRECIGEQLNKRWGGSEVVHGKETLAEVEEWMETVSGGAMVEDHSYLEYFYRCLDEDSEFYYLYEQGVGWACGNTTKDTPIRSKLVRLADAIVDMEQWIALASI